MISTRRATYLSIAFLLLVLAAWNYYREFFRLDQALSLGFLLALETFGMLAVGYFWLSKSPKFPRVSFWIWTLIFTLLRWLVVFFILQHHLPNWTVFHYPDRAVVYLLSTSATLIFLGYSYSIYEWGLAARMEYISKTKNTFGNFQSPIQIRSEGKTIRLLPHEIFYLEAKGEYVNYITRNANYMCFQRMKVAESKLGEYGFLRAHRSFIINPMAVKSFSSHKLEMEDHKEIPIGNTYKTGLINVLRVHEK
ncbi:MAG: LytTR family DNA-binding domain-containing protein [Bacteroidota bacterium]|nr:LytTR family DNA-binding domain-containing protein [uncultured Allomuricauda sp.]